MTAANIHFAAAVRTALGIRAPRNCFWGPSHILCINPLYKYSWSPDSLLGGPNREHRYRTTPTSRTGRSTSGTRVCSRSSRSARVRFTACRGSTLLGSASKSTRAGARARGQHCYSHASHALNVLYRESLQLRAICDVMIIDIQGAGKRMKMTTPPRLEAAQAEGFNMDVKTAASDNVKRGNFLRRRDGSYTNS